MTVHWSEIADDLAGALLLQEWHRIDDLLSEPQGSPEATDVASLLSVIVDDEKHRSELFSIVHAAESAEDNVYIGGFVAALPRLYESARWWARTLFVRVLNSESAFSELVSTFSSVTDPQRTAIELTAQAVEEWRPGAFSDRIAVLRAA